MHLAPLAPLITKYRYWILIPLSLLEGPMVAFATGALSSLGYFNPYIVYWVFVVKDAIVDGTYYYIGRFASHTSFGERVLARAGVTREQVERVRTLWLEHGWRTMFVGKLSWGLSPLFMAVAGIVTVPIDSFFRYAIGVALVQYILLFGLGYYFGSATGTVSTAIRLLQYTLAGVTLATLVYMRGRLRV
jgi:membrane protein DedA with SNARE-associated domain